MSIGKVIGKNIVSLRKQKRMTQEHLALYSDLSVTHLRDIEHGVANPTILALTRLANTLEVSVADLLSQDLHRKHIQNGSCDQITRPPPDRGSRSACQDSFFDRPGPYSEL